MKKILVLAADYPNNQGGVTLMYIHTRNAYYVKHGVDVTVLNFKATEDYDYEGISVITLDSYCRGTETYDILVAHAPNIRNHYRFLKKYGDRFPRFIFFFHGHEVLRITDTYSAPYFYMEKSKRLRDLAQDCYDAYKLAVWRKFYPKVVDKSDYIFVSGWMLEKFCKYTKLNKSVLKDKIHIIPNSVGKVFEENTYCKDTEKCYDFVTIRGNLDGSKYCVDVVNQLAENNPEFKFLVVGKGKYFDYVKKADNLVWLDKTLKHAEIIDVLNSARCALMPTRLDAQGVMMCEMATFGIPVISSNIDICCEISSILDNFIMIDHNDTTLDLHTLLPQIDAAHEAKVNQYFCAENTMEKEVKLLVK